MTKEDIIKLARECDIGRVCGPLDTLLNYEWEILQHFANLVAAAEREECANLCEQWNASHPNALAAAIRARGNRT
jgi:hypothetical protein